MTEILRIKHSFNAGDLITLLPGLRYKYEKTGIKSIIYQRLNLPAHYYSGAISPTKDYNGQMVCMNESMFLMLKPLLEHQEYIESFDIWTGQQIDIDIDLTRDTQWCPMPAGLIHHYVWALYPELSCDLSNKWIGLHPFKIGNDYWYPNTGIDYTDKIIINRTHRYTNPYISYCFLKKYESNILFTGTDDEYELFKLEFGLDIHKLKINNFLELAHIIAVCKLFIGNQSMGWHLADSLKINRILELCSIFPNTFPTGANGHGFYRQQSFEYLVNKALND